MIIKKRYKDKKLQTQYEFQILNPPVKFVKEFGLVRQTGAGVYFPFWRGYDGGPVREIRFSQAWISYYAGRERKRLEEKGLLKSLNDAKDLRNWRK